MFFYAYLYFIAKAALQIKQRNYFIFSVSNLQKKQYFVNVLIIAANVNIVLRSTVQIYHIAYVYFQRRPRPSPHNG